MTNGDLNFDESIETSGLEDPEDHRIDLFIASSRKGGETFLNIVSGLLLLLFLT